MSKRRIYEVAKELGVASKDLVEKLQAMGEDVKSHSSTIDEDVIARLQTDSKASENGKAPKPGKAAARPEKPKSSKPAAVQAKPKQKPEQSKAPTPKPAPEKAKAQTPPPPAPEPTPAPAPEPEPQPAVAASDAIHVHRGITVKEFADKLGKAPTDVIKVLMAHGAMKTITQSMADEEILVAAEDLSVDVEIVDPETEERMAEIAAVPAGATQTPRPPVVTVMGHVDHGKTTVLDWIREANVVAVEHGGITQHIGAYQISKDGQRITFLDTPGHEAFTSMRARGAQVTDIAILVVAADDGVMPQTLEALDHARAAHVPIIVAVNKIDKPDSDPTRVRTELSERGLAPEEWGGDTMFVDISAKTGQKMDDLLTGIILVSDDLELKAVPDGPARGVVLEAHLDKGRGPVATVLVQHGILSNGDTLVAGASWAKVRAMFDEHGVIVEHADPSRPVLVLGWSNVPEAGDEVRCVADERTARQLAQDRDAARRQAELVSRRPKVSLEKLLESFEELNLIVRSDQQGTLEAVTDQLGKMDNVEVRVNIVRKAVGAINESDVSLAQASGAIIVGFNVRPDAKTRAAAEAADVEIRTYRIIYELLEEIEAALKGMLTPEFREHVLGSAEVRETFKIPRGVVAGCYITSGEIPRNSLIRLLRDGTILHEGRVGSLRRFKEDVPKVAQGFECGIGVEGYTDLKVGDVIEAYEVREVART